MVTDATSRLYLQGQFSTAKTAQWFKLVTTTCNMSDVVALILLKSILHYASLTGLITGSSTVGPFKNQ